MVVSVDGDNATNKREKKKNFHALFSQNFSPTPPSKRLRTEHHARAESWGEGWRTREARRTKVEWPFAKLLDRKREIGCNPCAANRKCRTNISVPFLFPFPLSARVFLLSLPPSNFLGYTSPSPSSPAPLDPLLIGNHCHAANCQPLVHRIGSGANALSLRYSKSITEHKGRPLNPVQHLHFQHLHSLIASCHTPSNLVLELVLGRVVFLYPSDIYV